ncbi:MAG: hypothetical protein K8F25_09150, partial [Fimbriimonadaceae bacterium]|nr:hypothetical protein [Alphaproteobacteria bacterium]
MGPLVAIGSHKFCELITASNSERGPSVLHGLEKTRVALQDWKNALPRFENSRRPLLAEFGAEAALTSLICRIGIEPGDWNALTHEELCWNLGDEA